MCSNILGFIIEGINSQQVQLLDLEKKLESRKLVILIASNLEMGGCSFRDEDKIVILEDVEN